VISVLLPYRQAETTVEEAIDSILGQRGVDLELLAIDDGSRDGGAARVNRLAARHRALRPIALPGIGIARALTAGLAHAHGGLIARMDADDISLPDRLLRQREAFAVDPGLAVVGTRVEAFPPAAVGVGLARYVDWQNGLISALDHARDLFVESPLCHPSVLVRRAPLERVGGWRDGPWPEDYDLWLRLDADGCALGKVPEVLLRWRHVPGRATFADPRCGQDRFLAVKAPHLAQRLRRPGRPVTIWGAGPTGKRLARALEPFGLRPRRFVDIDPRKLGRSARGVPVVAPDALERGRETVVVAVGARGAREVIRADLDRRGFVEGDDFVCAA
jgi:hypothetical protein